MYIGDIVFILFKFSFCLFCWSGRAAAAALSFPFVRSYESCVVSSASDSAH